MFYYYREIGNNLKHTVTISSYPAVCYSIDNQELEELFAEALDKRYLIYADNRNEFVQVTYESAVTTSVKLLENYIKDIYKDKTGKGMTGVPLMQNIFNHKNPVLQFEEMNSQSGKDLQEGYQKIFAGVQLGISKPQGF